MKKIIISIVALLVLIGCSTGVKDNFGLGVYKDRNYINDNFNLDFDILEDYSFLNAEELKSLNEQAVEKAKDKAAAKHYNKVLDITNVDKVSLTAVVDSTPEASHHAEKEANAYLDFISSQNIAYKVERGQEEIKGLTYFKLHLELDFDKIQDTYIAVNDGKLINIQITYDQSTVEQADDLLNMLKSNE